jgi:hypothetical protein
MTRHRPSGGYGHHVRSIGLGGWRMSWVWDSYIIGSRLRYPRTIERDTDYPGAVRFAKKWGLPKPEPRCADDRQEIRRAKEGKS